MEELMQRVGHIESSWVAEHTSGISMSVGEAVPVAVPAEDEKEATFGKDQLPSGPSPELMTISLNDYGESDTESAGDFLSPKASPMNRMPGAPTHVPKQFNFNIPQKIPEEGEQQEESGESGSEEM
jgi:hypothetical protein